MPDEVGRWSYEARLDDRSGEVADAFECVDSDLPGMLSVSKRLFGNEFAQKVARCKRVREQPLAGSIVPDAGRHCEATATLALWRAWRATETAAHQPTLRPDCTVSDTHRHREPLLMANALVDRNDESLVLLGEFQSP